MSTLTLVDRSPNAMSNRAQAYLALAGARHFLTGAFLLGAPWLFSAAAFVPMFGSVPLDAWGTVFFLEGCACVFAAAARNGDVARVAMVVSATVSTVLGVGLAIGIGVAWTAWFQHVGWDVVQQLMLNRPITYPIELTPVAPAPPSPLLFPIILLPMAGKDLVMCAQPLRVPLEDEGKPAEEA